MRQPNKYWITSLYSDIRNGKVLKEFLKHWVDRTFFKRQLKIADIFQEFSPDYTVFPKIPPPIHPVLSAAHLQTTRNVKLWLRFSCIPPLRPHPCLKPFTIPVGVVLPVGGNFGRMSLITVRPKRRDWPDMCQNFSLIWQKSFKTATELVSRRPHVFAWGKIHIFRWIWLKNLGKTLQHRAMSMASSTEKETFRLESRKQETVMQLTLPTPLHHATAFKEIVSQDLISMKFV